MVVEEIGDFLVEGDEVVMAVVGGVGLEGRGHGLRCGVASAVKADC